MILKVILIESRVTRSEPKTPSGHFINDRTMPDSIERVIENKCAKNSGHNLLIQRFDSDLCIESVRMEPVIESYWNLILCVINIFSTESRSNWVVVSVNES